jgi:hypothetical protein
MGDLERQSVCTLSALRPDNQHGLKEASCAQRSRAWQIMNHPQKELEE